jgi:hypothetical protein
MRFPIKGTVFTVFFLLTTSFFGYLQPARAENTVTFKMVILPAKKIVVEDVVTDPFKLSLQRNKADFSTYSLGLPTDYWNIFYHPVF